MPDTEKTLSIDELTAAYNVIAPVWNDGVWDALQENQFDLASSRLEKVFAIMTASDWGNVYWMGLVKGADAMRGDIDASSWKTMALPAISGAAIRSASPQKLSVAYASIDFESLITFHNFVISGIPGKSIPEKSGWLKNNRPQIYGFFLSNPAGFRLSESPKLLSQQNIRRLNTLQENLRSKLFSFQSAEIIKKIAEQNNVTEEKISAIADGVGLVFLGFAHPEDLAEEIKKESAIAPQAAEEISKSANAKIFQPIRYELDSIYAPAAHDHELEESPRLIEEIKPPQKPAGDSMAGRIPVIIPPQKEPLAPRPSWFASGKEPGPGPVDISRIFSAKPPAPPATQPTNGPLSEFARLGLGKDADRSGLRTQTGAESKSADSGGLGSQTAAPKIIHEEEKMKPGPAVDFKLDAPTPKLSDIKNGAPTPPRPAIIEFGQKKPEQTKPIQPPTQRIVNYSNLKTALDADARNPNVPNPTIISRTSPPTSRPPAPSSETSTTPPANTTRFTFGAKKPQDAPPSTTPTPRPPQTDNKPISISESPTSTEIRTSADVPSVMPKKPAAMPMPNPAMLGDEKMMHPSPPTPPPIKPRIEPPPIPPRPRPQL